MYICIHGCITKTEPRGCSAVGREPRSQQTMLRAASDGLHILSIYIYVSSYCNLQNTEVAITNHACKTPAIFYEIKGLNGFSLFKLKSRKHIDQNLCLFVL